MCVRVSASHASLSLSAMHLAGRNTLPHLSPHRRELQAIEGKAMLSEGEKKIGIQEQRPHEGTCHCTETPALQASSLLLHALNYISSRVKMVIWSSIKQCHGSLPWSPACTISVLGATLSFTLQIANKQTSLSCFIAYLFLILSGLYLWLKAA